MLNLILTVSMMNALPAPQTAYQPCVMPNRCAKPAAVALVCEPPNKCLPDLKLAQYQPCVWPNRCAKSV